MQCINPIRLKKGNSKNQIKHTDGMLVPCGKCIACRIQKRKEWSMRMIHEKEFWDDSIFITLTYDDKHLPPNSSLVKHDLQKFFKRLRRDLNPREIKYFACGEYGDQTQRPHYHAIIFGLSLNDEDKQLIIDNWPYCDWTQAQIKKNSFGLAEQDSINYVAQYIDKKFTGDLANEEYRNKNREPVFRLLSLSIGARYCDNNSDQLKADLCINYRGAKQGLPRYYVKRLGLTGNSQLQEIASEKEKELIEHYTGIYAGRDELYKHGTLEDNRRADEKRTGAKTQHGRNLEAKVKLKKTKF